MGIPIAFTKGVIDPVEEGGVYVGSGPGVETPSRGLVGPLMGTSCTISRDGGERGAESGGSTSLNTASAWAGAWISKTMVPASLRE